MAYPITDPAITPNPDDCAGDVYLPKLEIDKLSGKTPPMPYLVTDNFAFYNPYSWIMGNQR
ncbi:MAG: hypothetical protein OPY06_05090 [Nitrosopumilus sp.]|nr:hypothetical protein [Nitrosopumilus sp.]MDF2429886.1 hypothetical protein [Nitrosopumilus sp.]